MNAPKTFLHKTYGMGSESKAAPQEQDTRVSEVDIENAIEQTRIPREEASESLARILKRHRKTIRNLADR